jgi:hypothetical protein
MRALGCPRGCPYVAGPGMGCGSSPDQPRMGGASSFYGGVAYIRLPEAGVCSSASLAVNDGDGFPQWLCHPGECGA